MSLKIWRYLIPCNGKNGYRERTSRLYPVNERGILRGPDLSALGLGVSFP